MEARLKKLKLYNTVVGLVLLVQGAVMWAISNSSKLPVNSNYLKWEEALRRPVSTPELFFEVTLGPLVASFLILSGLFLLGSAYVWRKKYEAQIQKGMNLFRWMEYSITSSLMVVVIAMLCGVYDFGSLLMIFSLNACMILFGWVMEVHNQTTKKTDWTSYIFGCFAGVIPWVVMGMYFFNAVSSNAEAVPPFVYYIFGSLFISFNVFAVNMILQYKKVGKWQDYLYGEYAYITLSLVAKALLAWQVWGGTLR
jgi:glucose uptake protein GlcU